MTAAIEYSLANHLACMIVLSTGGADNGGHIVTQGQLLGIYAGACVCVYDHNKPHGLICECVCCLGSYRDGCMARHMLSFCLEMVTIKHPLFQSTLRAAVLCCPGLP